MLGLISAEVARSDGFRDGRATEYIEGRMRTILVYLLLCGAAFGVEYSIVYSRAPRYGDGSQPTDVLVQLPEVVSPVKFNAGTDLCIVHPDGTVQVLVDAGDGQCIDPYVSFDGKHVLYAYFQDAKSSDIYSVEIATGAITRLTHQESTPNTRWGANTNRGVYNLGPCPLPGGRIAFTSSRNQFHPFKFMGITSQLFVMDDDGSNVECTGHLNLGGALHPTILKDGRIMWSSYESQGTRHPTLWGIWASYPDGREWEPLLSAFSFQDSFHFQTQLSDESLVITDYYNAFNNGAGIFVRQPHRPTFGSPSGRNNPALKLPFEPEGLVNLTPWTHAADMASGTGKVTHPSGAPSGGTFTQNSMFLLSYSPGPASRKQAPTNKPYFDHGIYLAGGVTSGPEELVQIINDPLYNENQPRAVVTYRDIYGVDEPVLIPVTPNDGTEHKMLPAGTPFGLIGTSGVYLRQTAPANYNTGRNTISNQGGDSKAFENSEIDAIRILIQEPTSRLSFIRDFEAVGSERLRVLGEIPLRKTDASGNVVRDSNGDPDTSFLARIPADTSFTFQLIDKEGLALTTSQTWHQLRPGEVRHNCGGCHFHHGVGQAFELTAASKPDYEIADLTKNEAYTVEYFRDIEPIFQRACQPCHSGDDAPNGFVLRHGIGIHHDKGTPNHAYAKGYQAHSSLIYQRIAAGEMPPPDSGFAVSDAERILIGKWIDLGCQIEKREPEYTVSRHFSKFGNGVFADDSRPTLFVSRSGPVRVGAFDYHSGLAEPPHATLNGEAFPLTDMGDSVWGSDALLKAGDVLKVTVSDSVGNVTVVERTAKTDEEPPPDELEQLRQEIAELRRTVEELMGKIAAAKAALE